ncbi:MAG: BatA domain-containing protein, partial [Parvularculaceae bacterium]|nr:BatA domain-containing protein [Parvularculaceae bacterium]
MGALSFSSPLILISLLALPAIWLVLRATPPAPQRVRFPAFDLLRRLARTRETPERTPWWVLLLRLLIAGLAILGLA